VKLFAEPFHKLLNAVDVKCKFAAQPEVDAQTITAPDDVKSKLQEASDEWMVTGKVRRLWAHDAKLWTGADENKWLGWLSITEDQLAHKQHLEDVAKDVQAAGFKHALLLGMGGSSLAPEVLRMSFGKIAGFPELHVLDSTDPAQIKGFENEIDLANTVFIVSSKSGTTLEPNIFKQYFFDRVEQTLGKGKAGNRFIAITDPGSKLEEQAHAENFRHIFHGDPSIGGRYSALSDFGMVPASVMGMDALRFLDRADVMAIACSSCLPIEQNPGVQLGLLLGTAAKAGRDKVTLITSPGIWDFGAWLEQLLAESTGKDGKGLIPVDQEALGSPDVYGNDRVFAYIRLDNNPDAAQDRALDALAKAGHPVVRLAHSQTNNQRPDNIRWGKATPV
jgi:transaldolase / glucose-6-phosphate isomerase